jgi:hypothetical protein
MAPRIAAAVIATMVGTGCGGARQAAVATQPAELAAEPVEPTNPLVAEAEAAVANGSWEEGAAGFEEAYQQLDDPQLLFESAMAYSEAEQWSKAIDRYETYLVADRKQIEPERAYAVKAEIDRLRSIVAGEEPVTWESLADQVYAERRGDAEADEVPPQPPAEADEVPPQPPAEADGPTTSANTIDEASLEDLLFYTGSKSSAVRLRAVRDLAAQPSDRARLALEHRLAVDTNIRVRIAAVESLVARGSVASIPALQRALLTVATSQERAVLKRAIAALISLTR